MKYGMGFIGRAALVAALACGSAFAVRPDQHSVTDGIGALPKQNPYREGFKKLKRLDKQHLLESGEALQGGKLALNGDATAQIVKRLNQRLKQAGGEVRVTAVQIDAKGNRHIRLQQYHQGAAVIGSDMVVHVNANGEVYATGGALAEGLAAKALPGIQADKARAKARSALKVSAAATERQAPRLVVFDDALAYELTIEDHGGVPALWKAYVDASTGDLLYRVNRIMHGAPVGGAASPVTGSVLTGEGGGSVTINGWRDDLNLYFLHNQTNRWGVYDEDRADWSQNTTGAWGTTDRAAVSLARNMELTQRYVTQQLGRNSFDNAGAFATATAHTSDSYVNAYWDGSSFYFGDGDGVTANPLTVLDVAAHEFGHAITQYTSGLDYAYESGALNESFSDIMGALVEFWAQPDGRSAYPAGQDGRADYLMGEDCWVSSEALRDLRNPGRFGQPSYYLGSNWYTGGGDNGGVHTNSGVQNFAFYLLAEGGTGSNDGHPYSITGLGFQASGAIAMYANMFLLTSVSGYQDAREAWVLAATTLGYNAQTVRDVWSACGVLEPVNNLAVSPASLAFGNVGVGAPSILNLTLSNSGAFATTVTSLTFVNAVFSSPVTLPLTVPGGSNVSLPVRFLPTAMGAQTGQITIASNADDHPSLVVPLAGTGTAPAGISVTPTSISAALPVGDTTVRTIRVTNTGVADLVFTPQGVADAQSMRPMAGGKKILFLATGTYFEEFRASLDTLPNVDSVDFFNAYPTLPTAEQLAAYDVVLVASAEYWISPSTLGNLLADYVDDGGGLILLGATFFQGGDWALGGRIMTPEYAPLGAAPYDFIHTVSNSLADHPINEGVTTLTSELWAYSSMVQGTGISLGTYTGGYHLGAYNPDKPIVSINSYPYPGYYGGDLIRQVGNAIDFVGGGNWLRVADERETRRVAQGASIDLEVVLDARDIQGGHYSGSVQLAHNVPGRTNPLLIPVTFDVDGFRRLAVSPSALPFGNKRVGSHDFLPLVLTNSGDEPTTLAAFEFSNPEFRLEGAGTVIVPGGRSVTVQVVFAPTDLGAETGTLTIRSNAEDNPVLTVSLSGAGTPAPQVVVNPASFALTLPTGESATRSLQISNPGGDDLIWNFEGIRPVGGTARAASVRPQAGIIDILAWVPLTDMSGEFVNISAALSAYSDPYTLETSITMSASELEAALEDKEVLMIPEQENGSLPAGIGAAFAPVLQAFLDRGGTVMVHFPGSYGTPEFMREAGLMDVSVQNWWIDGTITLVDPSHPLFDGLTTPLTNQNATAGVILNDGSTALATYGNDVIIAERTVGRGHVVLLGIDFYEYTPAWGRVLANAVKLSPPYVPWLTASATSGTLAPGQSASITLTADATGMLGGVYEAGLTLVHNAPAAVSPLPIPFTLTVDGVRSLAVNPATLDFGNAWQGTTAHRNLVFSNPGSESTTITALDFSNPAFRTTTALPIVIEPFQSATVVVDFVVTSLGSQSGSLTVVSDMEGPPLPAVPISGVGTEPPVAALAPAAHTFNLRPSDAPADRTSTLSNQGGDRLQYQITSVVQTGAPGTPATLAPRAPATPDLERIYAAANYNQPHARGEIIVALKPGRQGLAESAVLASLKVRKTTELATARNPATGLRSHVGRRLLLLKLDVQAGPSLSDAIARLKQDANVAYAEPNYVRRLVAVPDDADFGDLYGMHNTGQLGGTPDADIDAPEAWDRHTGNRSLVLGLIDTGIDWLHPDLTANVWTNAAEQGGVAGVDDDHNGYVDDVHGYDFINNDAVPMDDHGHGTHCSGTIGGVGNNGIGVAGVAWTANIAALKIFDGGGSTTDAAILNAVDYSNAMGMKITSNSWGGGPYSQSLYDLIAEGRDLGHLFIAAAGNNGSNTDTFPNYPSGYDLDNIISVAATDRFDGLAGFSNYGAATVDLGAPGVDIYSCAPGGGYQGMSGTSMATPHVSGAAYLVWSSNGFLTAAQVKAALLESVDPIPSLAGVTLTGGRLNVAKALQEAGPAWLAASPMTPGEVAPGASVPLRVTVNPAGLIAGTWTGQVVVTTDDPAHPTLPISVSAVIAGCKSLTIDPASVDFGSHFVGTVTRATLQLRNECNDTTTVSAMVVSQPAFRTTGPTVLRVPPFGVLETTLEFAPTAVGSVSGTLTLTTNADTNPLKTVPLTAIAVAPPVPTVNPTSIAQSLGVGRTATLDFTIGNTGGSPLEWDLGNVERGATAVYDASHFVAQAKGAQDPRVGRPVLSASGGPDTFGYRWVDSDGPNGPAYQWNDIRSTGQSVAGGCDDCYTTVPLSFAFPFYGGNFTSMNVTSNGWVNFGSASANYSNFPLPSSSMPGYLVAGFFDDLYTGSGGAVYFQDFGDRAVVQYQDVPRLGGDGTVTFQIVLHANGNIFLYYENVAGNLLSATTGIQDGSGTSGLTVQYNTTYVRNGLAVRFSVLPDWLRISELSGSINPGESRRLTLTLDATELAPGVYNQVMTLGHNNPLLPSIEVPVTLTVGPVGISRVVRVGPGAQAAAAGTRFYLWNITVGGEARGLLRSSRYSLYLK